jgi:hypothetical protein
MLLEKLMKGLNIRQSEINNAVKNHAERMRGGKQQQQQQQQQQQIAGNVKVYTGPKQGKFIINKHGKKVYIDRKTLNNNVPYMKKKAKKAKK